MKDGSYQERGVVRCFSMWCCDGGYTAFSMCVYHPTRISCAAVMSSVRWTLVYALLKHTIAATPCRCNRCYLGRNGTFVCCHTLLLLWYVSPSRERERYIVYVYVCVRIPLSQGDCVSGLHLTSVCARDSVTRHLDSGGVTR